MSWLGCLFGHDWRVVATNSEYHTDYQWGDMSKTTTTHVLAFQECRRCGARGVTYGGRHSDRHSGIHAARTVWISNGVLPPGSVKIKEANQ